MVKLNGVKDQRTTDSAPSLSSSGSGLICFICGAFNANWPLYCRSRNSEKMPFFPFLEYHVPADGARPVDKTSGQVDSCTVCFSFLTQQWHAFEESATPVAKRIYWLKRSGPDSSGERPQSPVENNLARGEETIAGNSNITVAGENLFDNDSSELYPAVHSEPAEGNFLATTSDVENVNPVSEDSAGPLVENSPLNAFPRRSVGLETCYICSRRKPKEFMRSVHTRPQLKTETPFYPCLARHVPPTIAKQMDYLGKVLVCEACQKFLFRQWQVFQKNSTPLSERQYQLRSDPSLPREQQSQLSTMVCFVCGVTQPATSGRFLYSRKHTPGHPYYPFLNNLPTPEGAMPLTKQGLTRACSGCRKSLHRQWKHFEAAGICEDKREYRIRNEVMVQSAGGTPEETETMAKIACYTCGQYCSESDLRPVHTKPNTNPLKDNFYFPFIASLTPPKDSRPLDAEGRTFLCKKCYKQLRSEWEGFEQSKKPQDERSYAVKLSPAITEDLEISAVCFLCGLSINSTLHFKLYSYPHSGKGVHDGGPFFPFLSSREPAINAQPIDGEGTAVTCEICYHNLMMQWNAYESSDIPEESNRWLRKYLVSTINCYLCCKQVSRLSSGAVNKQLISFPSHHQPPKSGILVNNGRDVVLCNNCQREVQRDLEAMDDSNGVTIRLVQEWDNQGADKNPLESEVKDYKSSQGRVIVIDSSEESEGDGSSSQLQNKKVKLGTNSSNASPMHYTTSLSPGLQPVVHNKDSTPATTDSSMSGGQASFAAALRKLAKQAKPVPASASSPTPSDSSSHSVSPSVSAISTKSTGMSPSRTSPPSGQTEINTKDKGGGHQSPGVIGVRTPPVPSAPVVDPDLRNHRPGEQTRESNRGPHRPEVGHPRMGREVMPGVFSTVPRGHSEVPMLSEHYPGPEPPHAPVAFYPAYGAKPELPIYVPRGPHPPGPPPLLASKRDGPEAHMLPAFYPTPYPPAVLDPHDVRFSTWRQQRAAEHLRQQHERHSILPDGSVLIEPYDLPIAHPGDAARHLPPGSVDPFVRKNSPHLRPGDNPESRETRKQESIESAKKDKESESGPGEPKRSTAEAPLQRGLYQEHKPGSCPVHGHGTPGGAPSSSSSEPPRSHGLHVRGDPIMVSKMTRPGEYKRMFLPTHEVPVLHPYMVHPPRDAPYPLHPLDERHVEFVRERERQEFLLHERLMFEQKDNLRAPGEDWPRHHLPQEKPGGLGVLRYPQPHHQQRLDTSKSPLSVDPHKGDPSLARIAAGREADHLYRGFPFHPFHHPPPDGKGFGDRYGNELDLRHLQPDTARRSSVGPSERQGLHDTPFLDSHPFTREGFHGNLPRVERGGGEREWQRRDLAVLVNGEYKPADMQRPKSTERSSPSSLAKRIKVERVVDELPPKIRHDPSKLRFLEGLGLVTVGKKKELSQGGTNSKRKYDGDHDNENGIDSPNDLMNDSNVNGNIDENIENTPPSLPSPEKLDFMAKLGLLPPSKRQELEQTYEVKRNERKNRKSRGRPPKRARRDKENDRDSDNSQGSLDPDTITGPITRQKQQLLQEQERKENRNKDLEKQQPVNIKLEEAEKRIPSYPFDRPFRRSSDERFRQSPTMSSSSNHVPPRLTLQSLTNMEDPFSNISASQFRPPYLRHTGLLSISHEHGNVASHARADHRTVTQPIRPEPLRSVGITFSEQETRDYLSQHPTNIQGRQFGPLPLSDQQNSIRNKQGEPSKDEEQQSSSQGKEGYKWSGIEAVMQSYYAHAAERYLEIGVLQDNADLLKSKNVSLNDEAQALNLQMTNLVQAKKKLQEEKTTLREGLDRLHFFIDSLKS